MTDKKWIKENIDKFIWENRDSTFEPKIKISGEFYNTKWMNIDKKTLRKVLKVL